MAAKVISSSFFKDRSAVLLFVLTSILFLMNLLLVAVSLRSRSYPVPVRYTGFDIGVFDRGQWYFLYILPAFAIVSYLLSFVLSMKLYESRRDISLAVLVGAIILFVFNLFVSYALLQAA